jgi:hypothetical protein
VSDLSLVKYTNLNYLCRSDTNDYSIYKILNLYYLQLPVQSVSITTNVVSSNPAHDEVYPLQYCVIKLSVTCCFLQVLLFPPPIKQLFIEYASSCLDWVCFSVTVQCGLTIFDLNELMHTYIYHEWHNVPPDIIHIICHH